MGIIPELEKVSIKDENFFEKKGCLPIPVVDKIKDIQS